MTKAVAAASSSAAANDVEKRHNLSTQSSNNAKLYRSALSLNNVDKKSTAQRHREDKFLRGSTTSLINTSREIPIILSTEVVSPEVRSRGRDESPIRPPRKQKTEKELSKKDLFFDLGASPTSQTSHATSASVTKGSKLKSSMSYSELARTSMLNSNYFKGNKKPNSTLNVATETSLMKSKASNDDKNRKTSYFFGESSGSKTTHFPADRND